MMRDKSCLGMDVWEDNEAWSVTDGFKMDEVEQGAGLASSFCIISHWITNNSYKLGCFISVI